MKDMQDEGSRDEAATPDKEWAAVGLSGRSPG